MLAHSKTVNYLVNNYKIRFCGVVT